MSRNHRLNPLWKKSKITSTHRNVAIVVCNVTAFSCHARYSAKNGVHLVSIVSSYFWAGKGPENEVRKNMATVWRNFRWMRLIICLFGFFWSQKVFVMAGRRPLKCDNSHWRSIDWFGSIHTENDLWNSVMERSMFDMCPFNVGDNYRGPAEGWTAVKKCRRFLSFFQRYIVRDISLAEIYRWFIEILSSILKGTRHGGQSRERL